MLTQLPSVGEAPSAFHPDTPEAARRVIATEGAAHTVVVYFVKKDGTPRRLVGRYFGATSRKPSQIVVQDLEAGAPRVVNLETVHTVKVLRAPQRPAPDREALPGRRSPKLQAMIDELAGFC